MLNNTQVNVQTSNITSKEKELFDFLEIVCQMYRLYYKLRICCNILYYVLKHNFNAKSVCIIHDYIIILNFYKNVKYISTNFIPPLEIYLGFQYFVPPNNLKIQRFMIHALDPSITKCWTNMLVIGSQIQEKYVPI